MRIQSKESIDSHIITQTCSNVCGVIVLCMAAIMCCNWQSWNDSTALNVYLIVCANEVSTYENLLLQYYPENIKMLVIFTPRISNVALR